MPIKRFVVVIQTVDEKRETPTPVEALLHTKAREMEIRYRAAFFLVLWQLGIAALLLSIEHMEPKLVLLFVLGGGVWEALMSGLVYLARRKHVIE